MLIRPITIYSKSVRGGFAGMSYGPIVLIDPSYRDDVGLHQHEYSHSLQWLIVTFLSAMFLGIISVICGIDPVIMIAAISVHGALYTMSQKYRLACELHAY